MIDLAHPVHIPGVDWETYKEISEELGESRRHISFDDGIVTIMPITELHELLTGLLHNFVTLTGIFLRSNVIPTGQATMRLKSAGLGVEPDLSYFVSTAASHKIKNFVLDELDTPPDIVVEIDFYHSSDTKFDIYSRFGVSEFWQYQDERLRMFKLQDGKYEEIDRSEQLPILTSSALTDFLKRVTTEEQLRILTDFQDWLQANK